MARRGYISFKTKLAAHCPFNSSSTGSSVQ
jgi:hypothetical protein